MGPDREDAFRAHRDPSVALVVMRMPENEIREGMSDEAFRRAYAIELRRTVAEHLATGFREIEIHLIQDGSFGRHVLQKTTDIALFKQLSFNAVPLVTVAEGETSELHVGLKGTMGALPQGSRAEDAPRAGRSRPTGSLRWRALLRLQRDGPNRRADHQRCGGGNRAADLLRFAAGESPRRIAVALNRDGVPGPSGRPWGPSTIYGNWRRGTELLNNELYVGRLVWNRQRFVKDPATGRRQARLNPQEEWVVEDVPGLRIVDDASGTR